MQLSNIQTQLKTVNHSTEAHLQINRIKTKQKRRYQLIITHERTHEHTHTHTFNGPFSVTNRVSRYQKGKTDLDFTKARDSEWQWHQPGRMQVCT